MATRDLPFAPDYKTAQTISVTTSAQVVNFSDDESALCLSNTGTAHATVRFGNTDATDGGGYLVLSGSQVVIGKPSGESRMTVIGGATTTLHIVCGRGI